MDWIEMVHHKNILPEDDLIIYGYSENDAHKVAVMFQKADYQSIRQYIYTLKD